MLVIDGWDPEQDWLKFLLDDASSMPFQSIYLFGATPEIQENEVVSNLVEDDILVCLPKSFAQSLEECGYFESVDSMWIVNSYSDKKDKGCAFSNSSGERYPSVP